MEKRREKNSETLEQKSTGKEITDGKTGAETEMHIRRERRIRKKGAIEKRALEDDEK